MKFIYYPLVLLWLSIFGQVVLWFGQAKYTLYLSEGTSELKRKFLALMRRKRMITKYQDYNWYNSSVITKRKDNHMLQIIYYKEGKNDKVKMKIIR